MQRRAQILCAWAGVAGVVVFFLGFWPLARFFPPLSPALGAEAIKDIYSANASGIKLGAICFLYSAPLLVAFYAAISARIALIEERVGVLVIGQVALGVLSVVPFIAAAVAYAAAVFRPYRDPALILALSDYGWLMLLMVAPPAMFQFFLIGFAILADRRDVPILPRWLGYFTWWAALVGIPGVVIVFFRSGPFAWSGLFGFYIPAAAFGLWTLVTAHTLRRSILAETRPVIP